MVGRVAAHNMYDRACRGAVGSNIQPRMAPLDRHVEARDATGVEDHQGHPLVARRTRELFGIAGRDRLACYAGLLFGIIRRPRTFVLTYQPCRAFAVSPGGTTLRSTPGWKVMLTGLPEQFLTNMAWRHRAWRACQTLLSSRAGSAHVKRSVTFCP